MGGAALEIRPIEAGDDPAVARIIRTVMPEFGCSGCGFAIHDAEVDAMSAAYAAPDARYWVVVEPGDRRSPSGGGGFARLAGSTQAEAVCELRKMYFLPEARGRGAGRALIDLCMSEARRLGYRRMYLETYHTMDDAMRLYAASGFRAVAAPLGATGHSACDRYYVRAL